MKFIKIILLACISFATMSSIASAHYNVPLYHWAADEVCYDLDALNSMTFEPYADEAVDDWNAEIDTSDFEIVGEGPSDCANDLFFTNLASYEDEAGEEVVGITPCLVNFDSLVVAYCDIQFDSQDSWTTNKSANIDFHHVALHEFGHWFKLEHVTGTDHIMHPSYTGLNTLHSHDVAGVDFIYDNY